MKKTATLNINSGKINLTHGGGGRLMAELIDELFISFFDNEWLNQRNDQAEILLPSNRIVITTDGHVVTPLFYPGGDIGSLSVYGTVNDIAMAGAKPISLAAGFILEEGFPLNTLEKVVKSMANAAKKVGVPIVTGDTKVVEKGKGDGIFITTTGIGTVSAGISLSVAKIREGDAILINGPIGDHGVAILVARNNLRLDAPIKSDSAPLHDLAAKMVEKVPEIHCMRDPTRGGVAATLNELATQSNLAMTIFEEKIPIREEVRAASEILGIDPIFVANEGKLIAFCPREKAEFLLKTMKDHPLGKESAIIGEVHRPEHPGDIGRVQMKTSFGGKRLIQWLNGEQLPRIC